MTSGSDSRVAAIQILAHEILYEIGMPASVDVVSRVSKRIDEAVSEFVGRARANEAGYLADSIGSD